MQVLRSAAVLAALAPVALATDIVKPSGFNVETLGFSPQVEITLADGTQLVRGGSFMAETLLVQHANGALSVWAEGFGSMAGMAQSPVTGDLVVGDSFPSAPAFAALYVLRDLNGDGDALDAGENVPHPAQPPFLTPTDQGVPYDLAFRPGTDELYMSVSLFGSPTLGSVTRTADGAVTIFADGFTYPGDLVWSDGDLYLADATLADGRVVRLRDTNGDDDALDAGEAIDFAAGLAGASGFVGAQDGSFLVGTGFSGTIARLLPDRDDDGTTDGVDPEYMSGFGYAGTLSLSEGAAGFVPGAGGEGELHVSDFFVGTVALRSAPLAELTVGGTVANDSLFTLTIDGAPSADGTFLLSLDPLGPTVPGIGDLTGGFAAPFVLLPLMPLDGAGTLTIAVVLHGQPGLVGLDLAVQGITLEDGRFGLSTGSRFVIG
ncbi:MAG: hypothetical protein H6825_13050 [Planctomycetes bacterium]|nr:hypothetical protein [Planctomycetota bacterium]